jgi:HSP90 family molecular chaperone
MQSLLFLEIVLYLMFYKYIFFSILATGYFLHRSSWWILDAIPDGLWRQEDSKCVQEGSETWKESNDKELKESFKDLTKWWKNSLSNDNVDDVKISNRLDNTPCVVVTSKFGWSANMERIMQSQTLSDASKQAYMRGKRVLEINPRHPIIKELRERVVKNPEVHYKFEFLYCLYF